MSDDELNGSVAKIANAIENDKMIWGHEVKSTNFIHTGGVTQAIVIPGGLRIDADGYDNPAARGSSLKGLSFYENCNIVIQDSTVIRMNYGLGGVNQAPFLVRAETINEVSFGDGITDSERYGMRRFIYHNNSNAGVPSQWLAYTTYAGESGKIVLLRQDLVLPIN